MNWAVASITLFTWLCARLGLTNNTPGSFTLLLGPHDFIALFGLYLSLMLLISLGEQTGKIRKLGTYLLGIYWVFYWTLFVSSNTDYWRKAGFLELAGLIDAISPEIRTGVLATATAIFVSGFVYILFVYLKPSHQYQTNPA